MSATFRYTFPNLTATRLRAVVKFIRQFFVRDNWCQELYYHPLPFLIPNSD